MTDVIATETVYWKGDEGYEEARRAAVWNERKPDRHPAGIFIARTAEDVQRAVRLAVERGLRVKAVAGGHSWTASGVRDDSLLVRVKGLDEIRIDPETLTASIGPGVISRDLNLALEPDLFFPTGHAASVGLGGFLLQGGWGWNTPALGPACMSVIGIDVVTADGELVHADETTNFDLLWAARGAGPGYFGIVTRFDVRLHPRPRSMMTSQFFYPLSVVDEVTAWAVEITPSLPEQIELTILGMTPRVDNQVVDGPREVVVSAIAITDSDQQSRETLRILESCPVLDRKRDAHTYRPASMAALYGLGSATEAPGYRYAVDNIWSNAGPDEIVPAVHDMFLTVPTVASHAALGPRPHAKLPDGALSIRGDLFIQGFTGWTDPADDDRYQFWGRDYMRQMDHISEGIQLADENLDGRPEARFLSDEAAVRLESLRAQWDPENLFLSYLAGNG